MKPVLYRYKDTESVIKVMDGYTPGAGRPGAGGTPAPGGGQWAAVEPDGVRINA